MSKLDIKNKLLSKYSAKKDLIKIVGIEDLGVDLYVKQINAQSRMRMADKAKEYYGINYIKQINAQSRIQMADKDKDKDNAKDIKIEDLSAESNFKYIVLMMQLTISDENGELIFDNEKEALEVINDMPDEILQKIIEQVQNANGLGEESAKKPVEISEKTMN